MSTASKVMPLMTLYGVPLSQPFRSVAWTLLQLQIPFRVELAVPGMTSKVGTKHDNFTSLTPHRSTHVPVLSYTDTADNRHVALSESPAIMAHVCERFGDGTTLYPPTGSVSKTIVDSYMHWHHSNTRQLARLFQVPIRPDLKVQISAQEHEQIQQILQALESGWIPYSSGDNSATCYIGGLHHPTIADILCYGEVSTVVMTNLTSLHDFPTLSTWMREMSRLPHHDLVHDALTTLGDLSSSNSTPISKRLGAATKAGLQGIEQAQSTYYIHAPASKL